MESYREIKISTFNIFQLSADTATAEQQKVWVAHQNLHPLVKPEPRQADSVVPGSEPFEFLGKQYRVIEEKDVDGTQYVLLGDEANAADNQGNGWIEEEFVVGNQAEIQSPNIPRRAMIKPPEDILEKERDGVAVKSETPVLAAPKTGAEVVTAFPWGSYHFVYGRSGDYVLIGSAETFDEAISPDSISKTLHGWVDKKNIVEGRSRETFWWNHENAAQRQPAQAFQFPEDAYAFAAGKQVPAFFEEISNSRPPDHSRRFPAFPYQGDGNFPRVHPGTNARLFKIGMLAQKGVDEKERASINRRIDALRKEFNQIDIVFVIDDTASMKKWFPKVNDIVDRIVNQMQNNEDLRVRIAISYFNDRDKITGIHSPETSPLESGIDAIREQLGNLLTHEEQRRVEADPAEMMFDGIEKAIEAAGYDKNANKMLIVIGTDPDKSAIPDLSGSEEHAMEIVKLLRPTDLRPIRFYAIQVAKQSGDRKKFVEQIEQQVLAPFRRQREEGLDMKQGMMQNMGGVVNSQDPEAIEKYVLDRFRRMKKKNAADQGRLRRMIHGDWDTAFGPGLDKELRARNIDPATLKHDTVEYQPVFVWGIDKDGRKQIRPWILMDEPELNKIEQFVAGLVEGLEREKPAREVVSAQLKMLTGDIPNDAESAEEVIKKKLALPISTPMLKTKLNKLADIPTPEDTKKLENNLEALQRVTQGQPFYTDPVSSNKWYWVDVESLP